MEIIITAISIIGITGLTLLFSRMTGWRVCPICAGVSLTWILILAGIYLGWLGGSWQLIAATAMGGSVVGIAYSLKTRKVLLFKSLFIPIGFIAAYELLARSWLLSIASLAILAFLAIAFTRRGKVLLGSDENLKVKRVEKEMEECC